MKSRSLLCGSAWCVLILTAQNQSGHISVYKQWYNFTPGWKWILSLFLFSWSYKQFIYLKNTQPLLGAQKSMGLISKRGKPRGDRTKTYQNAHVSGRLEIEWGKIPWIFPWNLRWLRAGYWTFHASAEWTRNEPEYFEKRAQAPVQVLGEMMILCFLCIHFSCLQTIKMIGI